MKVLLLSEYFPESDHTEITGGVEGRAFNIAKILAKKHTVTVMTSWRKGLKQTDNLYGINVLRVGPNHPYSNSGGYISRIMFARACAKEGKKIDADVVDGFNWTTYLPAKAIGEYLSKPVIATYHETWVGEWLKNKGLSGLPYAFYEMLLLKIKFDGYISVSEFTKKKLIKNRISKNKITVIPNGINKKDYFKRKKIPKSICFIGRLVKTKKADVFLRGVSIVKKRFPDIRCQIIGNGPELNNLKRLCSELDLEKNVFFHGFIKEHSKLKDILGESKILCHPGIVEGFGIILLESMASGTPYVCSDIDPFIEVTENGKGGFIFRRNNEKDLAEKIFSLLSQKSIYRKKQSECSRLVSKYSWEKSAKMVEETYEKVQKAFYRSKK